MKTAILSLLVFLASSGATAANFLCSGTGVYTFQNKTVSFADDVKFQTQELGQFGLANVRISIDRSNSDGTHYLGIEIAKGGKNLTVTNTLIKGSIKDMVMFMEIEESYGSPQQRGQSSIACLPLPN
jgi:hypothetical protein